MKDYLNIDGIIEDLQQRIGDFDHSQEEKLSLSQEQLAIKAFLEERRIHYLIHFTDAENIASIKEKGLLSIEQLQKSKIEYKQNDLSRNENRPDYISLSVSGMNQYVYRSFRYSNQTIENGVAIVIDAAMLYKEINTPRIYCITNAATSDASKGELLSDFETMFDDVITYKTQNSENFRTIDRNKEHRASYEPTDIQAEILWNKRVPTKYILCYWSLEEDFFYGN